MDAEKKSSRTMVVSTDEYQALVERVQALEAEVRRLRERLEKASEVRAFRESRGEYRVRDADSSPTEHAPDDGVVVLREVLRGTGLTDRDLRREVAVYMFEQEWLTLGQAARLAEMHIGDFMQLLAKRGIPLHYGVEEFQEDVATLKRLNLL